MQQNQSYCPFFPHIILPSENKAPALIAMHLNCMEFAKLSCR